MKKISREEFNLRLALHKIYVDSDKESGIRLNLSDADITGFDISGVELRMAKFDHCDLSEVNLENSVIDRCEFDTCIFTKAKFNNAKIAATTINNSDAIMAEFKDATFVNCILSNTDFRFANFNGACSEGMTRYKYLNFLYAEGFESIINEDSKEFITSADEDDLM